MLRLCSSRRGLAAAAYSVAITWLSCTSGYAQTIATGPSSEVRTELRELEAAAQRLRQAGTSEESGARDEVNRVKQRLEATTARRAAEANAAVAELAQRREELAAQTEFMRSASSLRTRDKLDTWVQQKRQEWNAADGRRIGVSNPYDNSKWYRYYDGENSLAVSVVKNDYEQLKRDRESWEQSYRRAKWASESVGDDLDKVAAEFGKVTAIKAGGDSGRRAMAPRAQPGNGDEGKPSGVREAVIGTWFQPAYNNSVTYREDGFYVFSNSTRAYAWKAIGGKIYDIDPETKRIDDRAYYTVEGDQLILHNAITGKTVPVGRRQ